MGCVSCKADRGRGEGGFQTRPYIDMPGPLRADTWVRPYIDMPGPLRADTWVCPYRLAAWLRWGCGI